MSTHNDWFKPIKDRLILVLDTETTGPDPETARIVELGAVYFRNGEQIGPPLNIRINPGCPIPKEASAVHGITDADVANAPTFADVSHRLIDHLLSKFAHKRLGVPMVPAQIAVGLIPETPLVVGYNILRFDAPLIDAEFRRANNLRIYDPMSCTSILDPYVFARWHHPDKPGKLTDLCEAFGISLDSAHAAWADAQATGRLLYRLLDLPENDRPPVKGFIPPECGPMHGGSGLNAEHPPTLTARCALVRQDAMVERIEAERAEFGHYFYRCRQNPAEVLRVGFGKHKGADVRETPADYWRFVLSKFEDLHPGALEIMLGMAHTGQP